MVIASVAFEAPLSERFFISAEIYSELPTKSHYKNYVNTGVAFSYTYSTSTWFQVGGTKGLSDVAEDYTLFGGIIRDY